MCKVIIEVLEMNQSYMLTIRWICKTMLTEGMQTQKNIDYACAVQYDGHWLYVAICILIN